jgi:hypothetical protein
MSAQVKRLISVGNVKLRLPHLVAFGVLALGLAGEQSGPGDLTGHEWGTRLELLCYTALA